MIEWLLQLSQKVNSEGQRSVGSINTVYRDVGVCCTVCTRQCCWLRMVLGAGSDEGEWNLTVEG